MRTTLKIILPLDRQRSHRCLYFSRQTKCGRRSAICAMTSPRRAEILGESLRESVEPLLEPSPEKDLQYFIERFRTTRSLERASPYTTPLALALGDNCQPPSGL